MNIKEYVLGFAFNYERSKIVLVEKNRPSWQKDKHNGVGGKLENDDSSITSAMIREFKEETGLETLPEQWTNYASLNINNDILGGVAIVHVFKLFSNIIYDCKTVESEIIKILNIEDVYKQKIINHLKILIPLALDDEFTYSSFMLK